jgi:hypothetical protein
MDYILRYELTSDDVEFLNITSIEYDLHTPDKLCENDSGWCDYSTGGYIVSKNDRAIFRNVTPEQETFLTLKYQDRLKELTQGFKDIYNVDE